VGLPGKLKDFADIMQTYPIMERFAVSVK